MTKDNVKKEIAHLLETITEQAEGIHAYEGKIPQIELDILMANIRNMYEQLSYLQKINSKVEFAFHEPVKVESISAVPVSSVTEQESIIEKIEVEAAGTPEANDAASLQTPTIGKQKEAIIEDPKADLQAQILVMAAEEEKKAKAASKKNLKTAASLFDPQPSRAEQFDDTPTLKQKISASKNEKSIADKLHQQKIDDLKKAIGINEKFLFINELFEGSLASYNEHIDKINSSAEINHALSIIDSLIAKYNWDKDQEIVQKFMDLINRRFA